MSKENAKRRLSEEEIRRFREKREMCFAILFEMTFSDDSIEEILERSKQSRVIVDIYSDNAKSKTDDNNIEPSDKEDEGFLPESDPFFMKMLNAFIENKDEVDDTIKKYIKGWTIDRLSRVTLSVLRFAVTELKYGSTSEKVVINEAVELSKKYSTPQDARFVNGVLGSVVKDMAE